MLLIVLIGMPPAVASTPTGERGVSGATFARVRFVESVLTFERPGEVEDEVRPISANSPIADGDLVGTSDGRAVIEMANSSRVYLDTDTRVEFRALTDASNVDGRATVLVLESGAVRVDVGDSAILGGRFAIDTAAGSIDLLSAGSFLVEHRDGVTALCTVHGAAELSGMEGSVLLRSSQRSLLGKERTPSEPRPWMAPAADGFVQFHDRRLNDEEGVDGDGSAWEALPEPVRPFAGELASYGTWSTLPEFGRIWRPATTGAWSPYARGYWCWSRTGWVWVSSESWGWAPYHYGRWNYASAQGWFWIPGAVWRGAWVAFAVGPSQVGWCPLDFWNRPVVQEPPDSSRVFLSAGLLDARGWQFVAADEFAARCPGHRSSLRSDRPPRSMVVAITGALPPIGRPGAARPGVAAAWLDQARASLTALPIPGTSGGQPQSFRALEPATSSTRARGRGRPNAVSGMRGAALPPGTPRLPRMPVATGSAASMPSPWYDGPGDPAVGRLIGGTRPPGEPPPGASPSRVPGRQQRTSSATPRPRPAPPPPQPPYDEAKPSPEDQNRR